MGVHQAVGSRAAAQGGVAEQLRLLGLSKVDQPHPVHPSHLDLDHVLPFRDPYPQSRHICYTPVSAHS